ncbi:hypothetical protein C7S15_4998 [Burkholderia cepacia]|nr:hypothetical protein [Burkholderia cepacia]
MPHGGAPGRHAAARRGPSDRLGSGRRGTSAANQCMTGILNGFGRDRAEPAPSARASGGCRHRRRAQASGRCASCATCSA